MPASPRLCLECSGECRADRRTYLLEVVEPAAPGTIVQLCSAKCTTAWMVGYETLRAALLIQY